MSPTEYQQLVEFLGRQFAQVDRRFTEVDRRLTGVDNRLTEVDGRLAGVDNRLTEVDSRLAAIDRRFPEIAAQLGGMNERLGRIDGRITELRAEMLGHFDELYRRLERLEQEYQAITQALRRIEAGVADDRQRRDILERDLAELKRSVAVLESRIDEIEQRLGR
jgi:chromosome segregation ATPase